MKAAVLLGAVALAVFGSVWQGENWASNNAEIDLGRQNVELSRVLAEAEMLAYKKDGEVSHRLLQKNGDVTYEVSYHEGKCYVTFDYTVSLKAETVTNEFSFCRQ